jgi:hypothetical protein
MLVTRLFKCGAEPVQLIRTGRTLDAAVPVDREIDRLLKPDRGQYPFCLIHAPVVLLAMLEVAVEI